MKHCFTPSAKSSGSGAVYGLGFLGALVYYLQHAGSVQEGLLGILKAIIWPAVFVYQALSLLKW